MNLPDIPHDKLGHFFYGTIIGFVITGVALAYLLPTVLIPIGTTIIAIGKELWDKFKRKKQFSLMDIVYTIISSILLYLLVTALR